MEAKYCTNCGRALTDAEAQFGVTTCASCSGSAGGPSTPAEPTPTPTPGDYSPSGGDYSPTPGGYSPTPTPGEERDVVGAGRYILNFFLAGFLGLALTYFLRFRGWLATWISLPIFTIGVIVIVVLAVIAAEEDRDATAFVEDMDAIMFDYQSEYTLPVSRAGLLLETDCTAIDPDPAIADCDAFMAALTDGDAGLVRAIERLKSLSQRIPDSAPEDIETLLADMIRVMELDHEANVVLAEGWYQQDPARWQEGWQLALLAAEEGLDFAESALRIAQELDE